MQKQLIQNYLQFAFDRWDTKEQDYSLRTRRVGKVGKLSDPYCKDVYLVTYIYVFV